jgi:hypothetical protein
VVEVDGNGSMFCMVAAGRPPYPGRPCGKSGGSVGKGVEMVGRDSMSVTCVDRSENLVARSVTILRTWSSF